MKKEIRIGVIGDYDGRPSHIATEDALRHCSEIIGIKLLIEWCPTKSFEYGKTEYLEIFDGLWCAPGSPYQSMNGALNAIQYAREHNIPFLGTCGGFQHAVIEFGRNVLHRKELQASDFDPYLPNDFITPLSCSLVGQTKIITISRESMIYHIYNKAVMEERYNCSFGLGREFQTQLDQEGFVVAGTDESGEARIMMLSDKEFYVATLFQPQLSSTVDNPHPLIMEFLSVCKCKVEKC